jgi:glucosamine--fructose-6-phosphate aminotransferase (isomerizing)
LEGALLFNEVARMPAIGMLAGSFRHGPVELVDEKFRALIFAAPGRTMDLNLALARDLVKFGGSVRIVGSAIERIPGAQWCDLGTIPEALAPLVEIIPVQVAAMRMAQSRGIPDGTFRYISQVARSEARF